MYGYLFVVDVQGLYCTMLKENNLQFQLKMVYKFFKTKKNALLISNIECTWPSAKIANSLLNLVNLVFINVTLINVNFFLPLTYY